jgi:hypothetical protein
MAQPLALPADPRPEEPLAAAPAPPGSGWSPALRIAFRFVFSYLVLFNLPYALGYVPWIGGFEEAYSGLWQTFALWLGRHVFHLRRMPVDPDLGGDTTVYWLRLLAIIAVAIAAGLAWTLLDRRRTEYRRLHEALRLPARYILGFTLFNYGMIKVIQSQFIVLHLSKLQQTYGDLSPMGLLWTFMSYSAGYNVFTGAAEAVGGILLFFRRTTLLGSLVLAVVLTHVVLINFSYDVIVKIYSLNLLLLGLFLLAPDLPRLADLLVRHRPTQPRQVPPRRFDSGWAKAGRLTVKALFIGYFLFTLTRDRLEMKRGIDQRRAEQWAVFALTYKVDEFVRNGRPVPPSPADPSRWQRLYFRHGTLSVRVGEGDLLAFPAEYSAGRTTVTVWSPGRKTRLGVLTCSRPDASHLVLTGTLGNDSVAVRAHKLDLHFFLRDRGFHWINEAPVDR